MYKLNCLLGSSVTNVRRQLATSLNPNGSSLCSGLQRTLCTTTDAGEPFFSVYPPLPGEDTSQRWGGKAFDELPIIHVKATYNNTHIQLTDSEGQSIVRTSCGTEGFKNCKKSTPIAAQSTGMAAAVKAKAKGVEFVRVLVKGLGPGRLPAIKGLAMAGLNVVSITDNTPVPHNGCRPRKARRM
ncbi:28S ribosomal protein S11, mitochondrial [Dicentrarchus labrax]|uniref:Small ribosomal subunit protein uS11m n=1 Tax=Dicentrarchus labrax TaxID=13489 RepID=A0A8C4HPY8_DICLA|nr:28S ribosomal protein S11, mitochondrial [Dicentrarchus labrax]